MPARTRAYSFCVKDIRTRDYIIPKIYLSKSDYDHSLEKCAEFQEDRKESRSEFEDVIINKTEIFIGTTCMTFYESIAKPGFVFDENNDIRNANFEVNARYVLGYDCIIDTTRFHTVYGSTKVVYAYNSIACVKFRPVWCFDTFDKCVIRYIDMLYTRPKLEALLDVHSAAFRKLPRGRKEDYKENFIKENLAVFKEILNLSEDGMKDGKLDLPIELKGSRKQK